MRFRIVISAFLILVFSSLNGQSLREKANKEYELFAFDRAVKTYLQTVEKEGYSSVTLAQLADCYRNLNQMANAEKWYAKATEAGPIPPEHIFRYAQVLTALQKYDEAAQWFTVYAANELVIGNHFAENAAYAKSKITDPTSYKVAGLAINTPSSDFAPTFLDNQLVVASSRTDVGKSSASKTWIGTNANRLFIADGAKTGKIANSKLLHSKLKNAFNEGPLSFSPDGRMVAFTKNNFSSGSRQIPSAGVQLSMFFSEVVNNDWTGSQPFKHNDIDANTGYPCFSPDGKALYFASDRKGGFGGYDIYVSYKYEENWSAPENLGPAVNSPGNEISPYFDGIDLSFSSDWHSGFGGYDVFRAEKNNLTWDNVYHLGTGINSSYDDYGFIFDKAANQGYLTSNRPGGKGAEDVYSLKLVSDQVVITVTNKATGNPIVGASVDLANCGLGIVKTDANGKIKLETVDGIDCGVGITMSEFLPQKMLLNTLSGKRDFRIGLTKQSDIVVGHVINNSTSQPLEDVTIKVTNRNTGITTSVKTDAGGKYSLTLNETAKYNLRYSKIGFLDINQMLRKGQIEGGLKTVGLTPIGGIIANESSKIKNSTTARSAKVTSPAPPPSEAQPIVINENLDAMITNLKEGYAIQIMSLKTIEDLQLKDLRSKYGDVGDIYAKEINGLTKVRVGMYESRDEATKAQSALAAKGLGASFIVPDIHPLQLKSEEDKVEKQKAAAKAEAIVKANKLKEAAAGQTSTKGSAADATTYKVRLAAYKNTKWFEADKVQGIGTLERIVEGDLTIMVLTGFENKWAANKGMEKAKKIGFKDAYVFTYMNGVMKRSK